MGAVASYAPLLALQVEYGGVAAEGCPVRIHLSDDSAHALNRAGYHTRMTSAGWVEICAPVSPDGSPRREPVACDTLSFWLEVTDENVMPVIAAEWGDVDPYPGCVFFSAASETDTVLSSPDAICLEVKPKAFRESFDAPLVGSSLRLTTMTRDEVVWSSPFAASGSTTLALSLHAVPDGAYSLALDDQTLARFYLTDRNPRQFWGAVEVAMKPPATAPADNAPRQVTVALTLRDCRWRYEIRPIDQVRDLSGARIQTAPDLYAFSQPCPRTAPDESTVWVFESEGPIPLLVSSDSTLSVALHMPDGHGHTERLRLPLADTGSTRIERTGEAEHVWATVRVAV